MIEKILFIFTQLLKYKNPDSTLSFCRFLIVTGATFIGGGSIWYLVLSVNTFDVPLDISFGPKDTSVLGIAILSIGLVLGIYRIFLLNKRITGLLIIHRGMEGMEIVQAKTALPRGFFNGRLEVIDIHEGHQLYRGTVSHPERALRAVLDIPRQISTRLTDQMSSDVKLAYAGLAPVPLLVCAGYVLSSRQNCLVLDYIRGDGWHSLDKLDDGEDVIISDIEDLESEDIAIVVSFSVAVAQTQIPTYFNGKTYFLDLINGPRMDSLSSEQKQKRIVRKIYDFISRLKSQHINLTRVHLFLAAQASFSFRLGIVISTSVHPSVYVYQFDPSSNSYTWGVGISNGNEPSIISLNYLEK